MPQMHVQTLRTPTSKRTAFGVRSASAFTIEVIAVHLSSRSNNSLPNEVKMDHPTATTAIESTPDLNSPLNTLPRMEPIFPSTNYAGDWSPNNIILAQRKHYNITFNTIELHVIVYAYPSQPSIHPGPFFFLDQHIDRDAETVTYHLPTRKLKIDENEEWTLGMWARMTAATTSLEMGRLREMDVRLMRPVRNEMGEEVIRAVAFFVGDGGGRPNNQDSAWKRPRWWSEDGAKKAVPEQFQRGVLGEVLTGFKKLREGGVRETVEVGEESVDVESGKMPTNEDINSSMGRWSPVDIYGPHERQLIAKNRWTA